MPFDHAFGAAQMDPFGAMQQMQDRMMQMHRSMMDQMALTMPAMPMDLLEGRSPFDHLLENPPRPQPGANVVSMSYAMTSHTGPDGQPIVKEAKQMNMMDETGVFESQYELRHPETDKVGLMRGAQERAVAVEKTRLRNDGRQHTDTRYRNMQEHELENFDREWTTKTQTPFWSEARTMQQQLAANPASMSVYPGILGPSPLALPPPVSAPTSVPRSHYLQGSSEPLQSSYQTPGPSYRY